MLILPARFLIDDDDDPHPALISPLPFIIIIIIIIIFSIRCTNQEIFGEANNWLHRTWYSTGTYFFNTKRIKDNVDFGRLLTLKVKTFEMCLSILSRIVTILLVRRFTTITATAATTTTIWNSCTRAVSSRETIRWLHRPEYVIDTYFIDLKIRRDMNSGCINGRNVAKHFVWYANNSAPTPPPTPYVEVVIIKQISLQINSPNLDGLTFTNAD